MFRQFRALFILLTLVFLLMVGPVYAGDNALIEEMTGVSGNASSQVSCALLETMLGGAGISLQGFNLSEQGFNLSEQAFNLSEQAFNLSEQSFNLSEQGFNLAEQGFNLSEQAFNLSEQGFNLAEQAFNLSEQGFNLSEQGFTVSEQGFNLSEQGFNISEQTFNLSEQDGTPNGHSTTFTWYAPLFTWTINGETVQVLMNYGNGVNVAAEVALHTVPTEYYDAATAPIGDGPENYPQYPWGAELLANAGVTTTNNSLHGMADVAVIFVDVGDETDPSTHMYKVVEIFNNLNNAENIPNLEMHYIDISADEIGFRVSEGVDDQGTADTSDDKYYKGIEGALRDLIGFVDADGEFQSGTIGTSKNIVINMSLAFLPCADMIVTPSGQEIDWDIDDFIEAYNQANNPDEPQTLKQVLPVAECVYTPDGKTWYARFGFINTYDNPMRLDAGGPGNRFVPNPQNRDQPSILEPGNHRGVLEVKFSKPSITWELTDPKGVPQTATAYIPDYAPTDLISWPDPVGADEVMSRDTATLCNEELDSTLNPVGSVPNADGSLSEPRFPIETIFECIREDTTGRYAVFSYYNWNDGFEHPDDPSLNRPARTVYVPTTGQNNKISPNPGNRGQTTYFLPGGQPSVFEIPFKAGEKDFTWTLINDWVNSNGDDDYAQSIADNIPDTMLVEAYPAEPKTCTETLGGTDLGNYLAGLGGVPEDEVLNVLIYLLSVETIDDDTDTDGLKDLLASYLQISMVQPSPYNIAVVAASGNYRPWFNVMWGIGNITVVDGVGYFEDEVIPPLSPARWHETIAVSASLGKDAWALFDDDNTNASIEGDTIYTRSVPGNGDADVEPWEDELAPETEDAIFNWMQWFFSHDGDIMARGAGYNIGTQDSANVIAGTSFASPSAAYVLAQYFSFPDACVFDNNGVAQPPVARDYPTDWANRVLEEPYTDAVGDPYGTPYWCVVQVNEPPVADDAEFSTPEDTLLSDGVSATDPENDTLTFELTEDATVSHGTLVFNSDGTFTYMPDADYNGPDSFSFVAKDAYSTSNVGTVTITVTPVNDAPVANDDNNYSIGEDNILEVVAPGVLGNDTDVDGDTLIVKNDNPPNNFDEDGYYIVFANNGLVTIYPDGRFYYTPDADYFGPDSFTYQVCDVTSVLPETSPCPTATVNITVTPVNDAPVAQDQEVSVDEDSSVVINLVASDVENDSLTYSYSEPTYGDLSGTAPNLTYTPDADYNGPDSFTFFVNDGEYNSNTATVTITIYPTNDAPVADAQSVSTDEDVPLNGTLTASDIDGDSLTFWLDTAATDGDVVINLDGSFTYTPDANFNGLDSFKFVAYDGTVNSEPAEVTITVNPINDAPVANSQNVSTPEETPLAITLSGSDVDGDSLTFSIVANPSHGTLSGTAPNLVYTPTTDYNGADSIAFKVNDGVLDSNIAVVSITVTPVNDAPVAYDKSDLSTVASIPLIIDLTGNAFDPDGDALTFYLVSAPVGGDVVISPDGSATFTPDANFDGLYQFTFKVSDGYVDSNVATVSVNVIRLCEAEPVVEIVIRPPNNKYHMVTLDLSELSGFEITGIFQDEPVDKFEPDAVFKGDGFDGTNALIRAQRDGKGDGRVYTIILTNGGECAYLAYVYVDHDARNNGAKHDSTKPGN